MKHTLLISKIPSLILLLIFISAQNVYSQKKGEFDEYINSKKVCCYVPQTYTPSKAWPLVIAMHPNQTDPEMMRQMLWEVAQDQNFILMCPDDRPDQDGAMVQPSIDFAVNNYNIDESNIVMTGYSAGGYTTQTMGFASYPKFKGMVLIAAAYSISPSYYSILPRFPIAGICGTSDPIYSTMTQFFATVEEQGGMGKLVTVPGLGHMGQYYVSAEIVADWTECYTFIQDAVFPPAQAVLSSPENLSAIAELPVTLEWELQDDAESYDIEISEDYDFSVISESKTGLTVNTYKPLKIYKGKSYYWRVSAVNEGGNGPWSEEWYFTLLPDAPEDAVVLTGPTDGLELEAGMITLQWNTIDDADQYQLQVFTEGNEEAVIDELLEEDMGAKSMSYDADELTDAGNYTWKVRGMNTGGEGPWSNERSFTIIPSAPDEEVTLLGPANGADGLDIPVTLSWEILEGADNYHLQVFFDDPERPIIEDTLEFDIAEGPYYEVSDINEGNTYTWKVCGLNTAGAGPWSDLYSFTTMNYGIVSDEIRQLFGINFSPNPVSETAGLRFYLPENSRLEITINDVLGNDISPVAEGYYYEGENSFVVNCEKLSPGVYFYTIKTETYIISDSFIVE